MQLYCTSFLTKFFYYEFLHYLKICHIHGIVVIFFMCCDLYSFYISITVLLVSTYLPTYLYYCLYRILSYALILKYTSPPHKSKVVYKGLRIPTVQVRLYSLVKLQTCFYVEMKIYLSYGGQLIFNYLANKNSNHPCS